MSEFTHLTVNHLRSMAASYLCYFREAKKDCTTWKPSSNLAINKAIYGEAYYAKYQAYKHAAEVVQRHEIDIPKEFGL